MESMTLLTICQGALAAQENSWAGCWKRPPASFSARQNPRRTPAGTPPVLTRLRP